MTTPIIIPMPSSSPSICPSCGKPEDIKEICNHCGHEYVYSEKWHDSMWFIIAACFLVAPIIVWGAITILDWFDTNKSLLEVLKSQWDFLASKKIF